MADLTAESPCPPTRVALAGLLRDSVKHHRWLLLYTLVYVAAASGFLLYQGQPFDPLMPEYALSALLPPLAAALLLIFGQTLHHALHVRPFRIAGLARDLRRDERLQASRLIFVLTPVVLIPVFAAVFTAFKAAIPQTIPFGFDQLFMALDRSLHFGHDPWRLLQPALGHPLATSVISYLYNLWFPLMYMILYWNIFTVDNLERRMRFLLSFVITWSLLGSLLALLLSSAGPVYYGAVTGLADPYAPLMAGLEEKSLLYKNWSLEAQAYLWETYQANGLAAGGGISAMPSLHVAVAVLQAFWGWSVSRRLGVLLTGYAAAVLFGSIHLGWHYAVDGYLAIVLAAAIWLAVGRLPFCRPKPEQAQPKQA